tara:strand:+ start:1742 stop:2170 length:429 start_codon:yes stop_codon:yes gene_type:complete
MALSQFGWTREESLDPLTYAGYDVETWRNFNAVEQQLLLTDSTRTEAQKNYYDDYFNDPIAGSAYIYTGLVDIALGTDSAQSADIGLVDDVQSAGFGSYDDTKETLTEYGETTLDVLQETAEVGKDIATIALVAGAYLLLKR